MIVQKYIRISQGVKGEGLYKVLLKIKKVTAFINKITKVIKIEMDKYTKIM